MPKRKHAKDVEDDLATLMREVKKLKRKIRRRNNSVSDSESDDPPDRDILVRSSVHQSESPQLTVEPEDWVPQPVEYVVIDPDNDNDATETGDVEIRLDTPTTAPNDTEAVNNNNPIMEPTAEEPAPKTQTLDEDVLEILGEDPSTEVKYANDIRPELASRLQHIAREGLGKEVRKELLASYTVPANCLHIAAPQINPEIKAALPELAHKRDKGIEAKQKQMTCAISCLGDIITTQLNSKDKDNETLRKLMDLSRMLCDIQHGDSATRRNFILTSLKKDLKEHLCNTKIDSFLFSEKLSDTIKSAKAVTKSGVELKADSGAKNTSKRSNTSTTKPLNRKAPASARRQPGAPQRSREPAAPRAPQYALYSYYRAPGQAPPPPPPPSAPATAQPGPSTVYPPQAPPRRRY